MYLTKDEERIYDGELGWAYQVSMRILVKLGDLYGAKRLIPIKSAHISGVSYKTIGDAPIEFLRALVDSGGRVKVRATANPSGMDYENATFAYLPSELVEKQREIIGLYRRMGVDTVLTCTPYYLEAPRRGTHLAWAESSAVVYANSILGAWTNREGGPSALASALIGKTPDYGLHQPENRCASVLVRVEAELRNEVDYGALGMYLGRVLGDKIPLLQGLAKTEEIFLKQMGAAMATSGMISMFHLSGSKEELAEITEEITVEDKDLREVKEELSTSSFDKPDLIFIGCPHCSLSEIKLVAELIRGKKVRDGVQFWVCTSRFIRRKAENLVRIIEEAGGKVVCDTCAVVTWLRELGVETLVTNSAKTAHYAPSMSGVEVSFSPLKECIKAAFRKII
ncbi:aconitase X catalytic domain-containing protein [Candidatus Bathyarchaeota archaeon]|nr:aconitase X catalytic domain-containing protein [Candidatus Bathyarchaeota archaeon]